jgi:hypothetical protein
MLQRTIFLHGLVKLPVIGSRFLAPATPLLTHCIRSFNYKARRPTSTGQVRSGSAVQDVVLLFAGISDSEVDDGPVGAGIIILGRPECALYISEKRSRPDDFKGVALRQDFGSVGFVASVKV